MKVHEIMSAHPRSVAPDNTLVEAAGLMREEDVGALPVMDGDDLAGMVTDRDIVVRGVADGLDFNTATVRDVMSGGIEFAKPEQEVEDAVRIMEKRQIRRLPVLNREKELVGMISLGDVATSSNPAFGGMVLRDVSQPREPSARRRRLARESEPRSMPTVPGARLRPGSGTRHRIGEGVGGSKRKGSSAAKSGRGGNATQRGASKSKSRGAAQRSSKGRGRR